MNDRVIQFLNQQTCTTICCIDEEHIPYCFSCFYALNVEKGLLYFKSSPKAHHCSLLAKRPVVAGTVLPDKLNKLATKGIQWSGEVLEDSHLLAGNAWANYHKKHPMALAMEGEVFTIRLDNIKMTDSKLVFGKKISWSRNTTDGLKSSVRGRVIEDL